MAQPQRHSRHSKLPCWRMQQAQQALQGSRGLKGQVVEIDVLGVPPLIQVNLRYNTWYIPNGTVRRGCTVEQQNSDALACWHHPPPLPTAHNSHGALEL